MDTSAHTQDILDMISNLPAAPETHGQPIAGVALNTAAGKTICNQRDLSFTPGRPRLNTS